jgi:N-acyl-D-aspartate/D-glutamate deacylase
MLDLAIRGGLVADGTGAPMRRADVGVRDGRIVSIGPGGEQARRTIQATGLVVAPGFIDVHTHYDAQVMWDPMLSPSSACGVTTVISGNCGFTIAPLVSSEADYVMRMLGRVEGMPVEALAAGCEWDWSSFGDWLSRLDGHLAINAGFLAGHNAIRRVVMGDASVGSSASPEQLAGMQRLLGQCLEEGALGFSTTRGASHNDHRGDPVPSRWATDDELLELCREVGRHPGTSIGMLPTMSTYDEEVRSLMTAMATAADRPLNWNALSVRPGPEDEANRQAKLACADHAQRHGARVVGLVLAQPMRMRLNLGTGVLYDSFPDWAETMHLGVPLKMAALRSPAVRARLRRGAMGATSPHWADWANCVITDVGNPEFASLVGRRVGAIAAERGADPFDAYLDLALADGLATGVEPPAPGDDEESWRQRAALWQDPRLVVGGSDAGAHLDMMQAFNGHLSVVGSAVRDRELLPLEAAVRLLTEVPARLFGLRGRGRVTEGWRADLVVFDPARVAAGPVEVRHDLPGGAWRLYGEAVGIEKVIVNGSVILDGGQPTGNRPGLALRSGRDTEPTTVEGAECAR